jgi:hypothetical protein
MQIPWIALIYPVAGELGLNAPVVPDDELKSKSGSVVPAAADAIGMGFFSFSFKRLLRRICHIGMNKCIG